MVTELARRHALQRLTGLFVLAQLAGCERGGVPISTAVPSADDGDPEAALYYRYRGIPGGGELYIDADYETKGRSVIYDADGVIFEYGHFSPKNRGTKGYFGDEVDGGMPVPRTLRMVRYPEGAERNPEGYRSENLQVPMFLGPPLVDVTVPVASRIPDDVLDRIREYKGGLKLKLRLTRETLLIGWEVMNGKNYPFKIDRVGNAYATDDDTLIGGDFAERRRGWQLVDGVIHPVQVQGWQIDFRTGQRVKTDF